MKIKRLLIGIALTYTTLNFAVKVTMPSKEVLDKRLKKINNPLINDITEMLRGEITEELSNKKRRSQKAELEKNV